MTAAERALEFVKAGDRVGLGTGHAAAAFVDALAARVRDGLHIEAVATSEATAARARALGIQLTTLDAVEQLDVTVDGADEVDPQLDLIKGYGGALVRERVVATASRRVVILVGTEKLVRTLGARGTLPVEVVRFALPAVLRGLAAMGFPSTVHRTDDGPFVTDNGNYLLHARVTEMREPAAVLARLRAVPGVVDAGLFLGLAEWVLVQDGEQVRTLQRAS